MGLAEAPVWSLGTQAPLGVGKRQITRGKFSRLTSLRGQFLRQAGRHGLLPSEGGWICPGATGCKHLAERRKGVAGREFPEREGRPQGWGVAGRGEEAGATDEETEDTAARSHAWLCWLCLDPELNKNRTRDRDTVESRDQAGHRKV